MSQPAANETTSQNIKACHLVQIPAEILDRITWHLTTPELCNLRLTCKSVEEALYFRFTAEFFTRKQFMVSEFSLKALIDISKSRLSECLRHVHLGIDQLDLAIVPWQSLDMGPVQMFQHRLVEQETLWTLGLVPKYLAEAFANLSNLESVVVRDFNSNRRSRDGPHAHWLSYGTQTMFKETTVRPRSPLNRGFTDPTRQDYASRLFKAVIHALGMAKASPATIEVMERHGNMLLDSAFQIHPSSEADIAPVLRGLKRLHLCLDVTMHAKTFRNQNAQIDHQFYLAKFLRYCDGLEELRINGDRDHHFNAHGSLHKLFDWFAATEPATATKDAASSRTQGATNTKVPPPPPAAFPRLENISLGMMALTVDAIVNFVAKVAGALQYLELWRIEVLHDQSPRSDSPEENRVVLVRRLLKKLLAIPNLNLRHIKLGNFQEKSLQLNDRVPMRDVYFKPTAKTTDEEMEAGFDSSSRSLEYTGTDWRHFVTHEMIPRLYTPKIKNVEASLLDDDEDEDSDNEDEDEDDDNDDADDMDQDEE
ncbi:hypothetical protein V8C35DRAFT_303119 [Trichoderma chlorosporum]